LTNTCLPEVNEIWDVSELFREWPLFPEREFKDLASASISLESDRVQIQPNLMQVFFHKMHKTRNHFKFSRWFSFHVGSLFGAGTTILTFWKSILLPPSRWKRGGSGCRHVIQSCAA